MKVGDLVKLSAYGKARQYNRNLTSNHPNQFGLIVEIHPRASYPFRVKWLRYSSVLADRHCRRELAYAS